ncbi:MAG TPA: glycine cleavage system protein GcvH [Bacteroidales bacterium]|nr:glycine cleavage system protein GcvH [Lentimicrobiaceae bacterium]HOH99980.1 glycine cleavage system protein GcvH [Bacteroidales bacterium]
MIIPEELRYTKDHEWLRVEGEEAVIGITDYAQGELGDIVFIEVDVEGEILEIHETFGTIEAVKTVSDMYMPVGGEVLELNPALDGNPELVNKDPFGEGWIIRIRMTNPAEVEGMLTASAYRELIKA